MKTVPQTLSLFPEMENAGKRFPQPQYLGAKFIHRDWIKEFIPDGVDVALDAFSGSQSIAYMFKQLGLKTITNDFLHFNGMIGKALIENKADVLTESDMSVLMESNSNPDEYNLIDRLFTGLFFTAEDSAFIDSLRSNIPRLASEYKRALAFTIANRALTRKVTMGHFAHTQALAYAADPARVKRNRSLVRPVRDLFVELADEYNAAVFDNGCECESHSEDIMNLLPRLDNVDMVYFDPPYCSSHADYQSFYHLLETFTVYWKDKEFVNGTKRYSPKRHSGFDTKGEAMASFGRLFEMSDSIPYWLISYNDRSYPDIDTFVGFVSRFRKVRVEKKQYGNSRGGKGSVAGSHEVLLVCNPY